MENNAEFNANKAEHYIRQAINAIPRKPNRFYDVIRKYSLDALKQMDDNMVRRYAMDALKVAELGHEKGEINNKNLVFNLQNAIKSCDKISHENKLTSPQRRTLIEKTLSTKEKKKGPFALPAKNAYPIPDESHGKNALSRAKQYASPEDQATIRKNVKNKFPNIDVEMKPGKPTVKLGPTSRENKKIY